MRVISFGFQKKLRSAIKQKKTIIVFDQKYTTANPFGILSEIDNYQAGHQVWPKTIDEMRILLRTGLCQSPSIFYPSLKDCLVTECTKITEENSEEFEKEGNKALILKLGQNQNFNAFSYLSISEFIVDMTLPSTNKHKMLTLLPETLNSLPVEKNQSLIIAFVASYNIIFGDAYGILTVEKVKDIFLKNYTTNIDYDPKGGYGAYILPLVARILGVNINIYVLDEKNRFALKYSYEWGTPLKKLGSFPINIIVADLEKNSAIICVKKNHFEQYQKKLLSKKKEGFFGLNGEELINLKANYAFKFIDEEQFKPNNFFPPYNRADSF